MKKSEMIKSALGIAFVFIVTAYIAFPIGSFGYINIGDALILMFASILSPLSSLFVGAIGSALADLMLAPQYAIFTCMIKGLEGVVVSYLYHKWRDPYKKWSFPIGGFIVIAGYALSDVILTQQPVMALASIGFNLTQVIICLLIAWMGLALLQKVLKKSS